MYVYRKQWPNCSEPSNAICDLTGTGLADVHCEDTEETGNDDTDDYIFSN
ncbi:MAG: hypothetical protein IPH31_10890 [Lewinellaceae bacterium]|nr:hypothetical protein [Lewinellaceae bacterium]